MARHVWQRKHEVWDSNIVVGNFLKALVAVILGNLIYFLVLAPLLPPAGRHEVFRIDAGLAIDFGVCVVVYGLIQWLTVYKSRRASRR